MMNISAIMSHQIYNWLISLSLFHSVEVRLLVASYIHIKLDLSNFGISVRTHYGYIAFQVHLHLRQSILFCFWSFLVKMNPVERTQQLYNMSKSVFLFLNFF